MDVTPQITVLMSCYNSSRWIEEAINSILIQTFKDFEFIIIDDGSNDNTIEILRKYSVRDSRVIIVAKLHTGLADSLNVGIRMARGKWIARLDADDICEPTRLQKQYEFGRLNTKLVFLGTGLTTIDQYGNKLAVYRYPTRHTLLLRNLKTVRRFPPHSSAYYRTDAVRAINGYSVIIRRAQDVDLWLRLSEIGELACLEEPLVKIRQHSNQISHDESGRSQQIYARVAIISYYMRNYYKYDRVFDDENTFNEFKVWIERRLEEEHLFMYYNFKNLIKELSKKSYSRRSDILEILNSLFRFPDIIIKLIYRKLLGENLSHRLAKEWIRKS
jgi:glycosyltransferase involved in cell wall biosynthesis